MDRVRINEKERERIPDRDPGKRGKGMIQKRKPETDGAGVAGSFQNTSGKHNGIAWLLCLFAAFLLWIYVMAVESPYYETEIRSVQVKLENEDVLASASGFAIYSGNGTLINITVSGKKSITSKLTADDILATADASLISGTGRQVLPIRIDLPSDVALIGMSQDNVVVFVDENVSDRFTLEVQGKNLELDNTKYILDENGITLDSDTIAVTGPKRYVDSIEKVVAYVDYSGHTSSFETQVELEMQDKYGVKVESAYLKCTPSAIRATVPIYTYQDVPVEVQFQYGYLNDTNTTVTVTPSVVRLLWEEAKVPKDTVLLSPIVIDEKKITGNTYSATRSLRSAENVIIDGVQEVNVDVTIDANIGSIDFELRDIEVTGASGINYTILTESLPVTLRGPIEKLRKLRLSDLSALVDLSSSTANGSAILTKSARIVIDAEDAEGIYEVGEYTVQVQVDG